MHSQYMNGIIHLLGLRTGDSEESSSFSCTQQLFIQFQAFSETGRHTWDKPNMNNWLHHEK